MGAVKGKEGDGLMLTKVIIVAVVVVVVVAIAMFIKKNR